jgi:DNA-binding transcriptional LysR family regulator
MSRQFDDVLLGSIELFCLAAEHGGFTAAALVAGVTPTAVSRSISRLEARLGLRLFVRTTRSVKLTEVGRTYFEQCRLALAQLVEAEREAMGRQAEAAGTLRISIPTTYGHHRVLPLLPAFRLAHPGVKVHVHLSNRNIDFVEEGYDMAIRVRAQPECIQYELPSSGRRIAWLFNEAGKQRDILADGALSSSDDVLAGVTLAKHHGGLFQTYRFIVEKELASGELVEVLTAFNGRSRPFTLLYPSGRHLPLRMRVFVDFLLAQLGGKR